MSDTAKKIIYVTVCSLILLTAIVLAILTIDNKKIRGIEEFISSDVRVLYVTSKKNNYPTKLLTKYGIEHLEINSPELTFFERKKIRKIINTRNIESTLVIYNNGEIVDTLENFKKEKDIDAFFQKNKIIPEKISNNVEEIMSNAMSMLESEYSMIYIPYIEHRDIDAQNKFFEEIASEYSIDYKRIDAYLLSNKQQEKINTLLNISLVDDQILILVKENKVIANIRGVHRKNTFIEKLYDVNFINEIEDKIVRIGYEDFDDVLMSTSKNIILVGSESIKDSNDIYILLNKLIYNYDIEVKYINVEKNDSEMYNKVKEKLEKIGYEGAYSVPIVLVVESNNIIDYIIGNTKEEYFVDTFIENGVIKGEVNDE